MTYVLMDVGCLECRDPSTLIGIYDNDPEAVLKLEEFAKQIPNYSIIINGLEPEDPYSSNVRDLGPTCIMAAGGEGSYWYHLQLHYLP